MDKQEYTRIVELYYDDIKRVAFAGCKNIHDAEDIAQAVFLKLLKHTGEFENYDHLKKWLIRVTVNECKSLWRSPWKTKVDYFVPERAVGNSGKDREKIEVMNAVLSLKQKYREIVHLFYFEEYSAKEISEILGVSEGTVFKRLQRAREQIKEYISKNTGDSSKETTENEETLSWKTTL